MASAPPRPRILTLADLDLVIRTPRLLLRPLTEDDVDAIFPIVSDPAFPRHMSWNAHTERSETVAWVQSLAKAIEDGAGVTWAIEHAGHVGGCIGLGSIRWQVLAWRIDRSELGYWLAPALWNRGLMSEAVPAVIRWGFGVLGLHKITVGCFAENVGSRRVIEKAGFRPVGRLENDVWRDDQWHAHLRYELTAAEHADPARSTDAP